MIENCGVVRCTGDVGVLSLVHVGAHSSELADEVLAKVLRPESP